MYYNTLELSETDIVPISCLKVLTAPKSQNIASFYIQKFDFGTIPVQFR